MSSDGQDPLGGGTVRGAVKPSLAGASTASAQPVFASQTQSDGESVAPDAAQPDRHADVFYGIRHKLGA